MELGDVETVGTYAATFKREAEHLVQQCARLCKGLLEVFQCKGDGLSLRNALEMY